MKIRSELERSTVGVPCLGRVEEHISLDESCALRSVIGDGESSRAKVLTKDCARENNGVNAVPSRNRSGGIDDSVKMNALHLLIPHS